MKKDKILRIVYLCLALALCLMHLGCISEPEFVSSGGIDFEESKTRGLGQPRKVYVKEVKKDSFEEAHSSNEAARNLKDFIAHIFSNTPNLFFDKDSQEKWLSKNLRDASAHHLAIYLNEEKSPHPPLTFPDNSTFIGAWEDPSSYSVIGLDQKESETVIDVIYEWGAGMNYAGDTRKVSFKFIFEEDAWKIEDIHHHKGEYNNEYNLSEDLWKKSYE